MMIELKEKKDFVYSIMASPGCDFVTRPLPPVCKAYDVTIDKEDQEVTGIFVDSLDHVWWIDICTHSANPKFLSQGTVVFRISASMLRTMVGIEKTPQGDVCVSNPFITETCPWPLSLTRKNKLSVVIASTSPFPRVKASFQTNSTQKQDVMWMNLPRNMFSTRMTRIGERCMFKEFSRSSKLKEIRVVAEPKIDFQVQVVSSSQKVTTYLFKEGLLSTSHGYHLFPLMDFTDVVGVNIQWSFSKEEENSSQIFFGFLTETELRIHPMTHTGGIADYENINNDLQ
jgi:hypothetical protein